MRPQGKGVYEECALGLEFMVVKPHPVAMIRPQVGYIHVIDIIIMRPSGLGNIQAQARGQSPEGELPCILAISS